VPGAEIDGKIINRPAITRGRGMAVSKFSKKKEVTMKVLECISLPHLVPDPVVPVADEHQRTLSLEITEALAKRKPDWAAKAK
jgi:hypothetical protein